MEEMATMQTQAFVSQVGIAVLLLQLLLMLSVVFTISTVNVTESRRVAIASLPSSSASTSNSSRWLERIEVEIILIHEIKKNRENMLEHVHRLCVATLFTAYRNKSDQRRN